MEKARPFSLDLSRFAFLVFAPILLAGANVPAAGATIPHGTVDLVAQNQWIVAGRTLNLGLHFQLEKGWHIYWVNPGDSGEPPRVKWQLPAGVNADEIEWPTPRRLGTSSIVDFGYEDKVMLLVPLRAGAGAAGLRPGESSAQISGEVKMLVCREMCIPGKVQVSLTLPVKSQPPAPDAQTAELFAAARKALPQRAPGSWRISVTDARDAFVLTAKL